MTPGAVAADAATPGTASHVWSIATGRPFLDTLASAILAGDLPHPGGGAPDQFALAGMTILLPTNRAVRAMQDAFLRAAKGRALLLPRLMPIAASDEEGGLLADLGSGGSPLAEEFTLPPAIGKLERQLTLTQLVLAWSQISASTDDDGLGPLSRRRMTTPAQAAHLAAELAQLMDMVETESRSLDGIATLVPDEYSAHWQRTIDFLKILTEYWPAHLAERERLSPADRRNQLICAEAERLRRAPPAGPLIVAGVSGSVPATIELIRAVAALPQGAVVLPGLDRHLDDAGWQQIATHPEHPQFGHVRLLAALDVLRADVGEVAGADISTRTHARNAFLSEAMRPAGATEAWADYIATTDRAALRNALEGVTRVDAPTGADEAEVIALMMREAVEKPGRTAALVSPDRLLARRVAIRLESWGITVDDSAGRPLAKTTHGAFLELAATVVANRFAPADVMALLKHPLTRLGLPVRDARRAARTLELAAVRTIYLGDGLDGLAANLERARQETLDETRRDRAARRLWDEDWQNADDLVRRLRAAMEPLTLLMDAGAPCALQTLAAAHRAVAEALARAPDDDTQTRLWQDEDGEAADRLLASLDDESLPAPQIAPVDYPDFYRTLATAEPVRPRVAVHPRLSIWGPYEARLQQPDLVILGSLNEGTWPTATDPGAWLNRPMRATLGLPSPEEAIGRAAQDITGLFGAREVVLTRAGRVDGAPTVPSRWLMRIDALLGGMDLTDALRREDQPWLAWARARDAAASTPKPVTAPEPRPALTLRPRQLSVSAIELWIGNPYGLYARYILGLEPLPLIGAAPGAREKGIIIHDALSRFTTKFAKHLPDNIAVALMAEADEALAHYAASARVRAFWRPRIARFADWFAQTESARRAGVSRIVTEVAGKRVLAAPVGPFTLTARADRIDYSPDRIVITDYKTGTPPSGNAVKARRAPQLPLEAAIASEGGFAGVETGDVAELRYIRASGGSPAGKEHRFDVGVPDLAAQCFADLERLVADFDDPARAYTAIRRARFSYDYDDFAHLARVAEWSSGEDGDEDDANGNGEGNAE